MELSNGDPAMATHIRPIDRQEWHHRWFLEGGARRRQESAVPRHDHDRNASTPRVCVGLNTGAYEAHTYDAVHPCLDNTAEHAYPTDAKERERDRRNAQKAAGHNHVVKKRPKIVEEHYDDCGEDLSSLDVSFTWWLSNEQEEMD